MQLEPWERREGYDKEITMNMHPWPKHSSLQNPGIFLIDKGSMTWLPSSPPKMVKKITGATTYTKDLVCKNPGGRVASKGEAATPVWLIKRLPSSPQWWGHCGTTLVALEEDCDWVGPLKTAVLGSILPSCGVDNTIPVGLEDRASSQRGLFSSLKI